MPQNYTTMNTTSLLFVPSGGLANRMRAVASAYSLSKKLNAKVQVVWFKDWTLNAPFDSIFMPVDTKLFKLREAGLWDKMVNDRPRQKNFYLFNIPQSILYRRRIYEKQMAGLKEHQFDFLKWAEGHRCYMSCYHEFGMTDDVDYTKLFRPTKEVQELIDNYTCQFSCHTIGLHIRRTDHSQSIAKSPTTLFFDYADKEIATDNDTRLFLATDSEAVKEEMTDRYGERIITSASQADRNSITGIREGLADMWALSKTARIYGSSGSSFSPMASRIGGTPLVVVEK